MADRPTFNRRTVLASAAVGAGALTVAGCSAGGVTCAVPAAGTAPSQGGGGGEQLAVLADIGVGEAVLAGAAGCGAVVVARPTDSTAVAFSAICPHKGVIVAPRDGQLHCPAHDALFNLMTGAVEQGPADRALTSVAVSVLDGRVLTT